LSQDFPVLHSVHKPELPWKQCPHWADLSKTCFLAESFPTVAMCYFHPLLAHTFSFLFKKIPQSFFFVHLFTCAYIVWLISLPWAPPHPSTPLSVSDRSPSALSLILLTKRHIHNKEDKEVLLVKDSYTERFLLLRSCTYVLRPMLIQV
jgi:hypothetical protein